ncbi:MULTISPECIES: 3,4-dihydroxy-2-butanone-4-phosphate synthase [unclassified Chelatococcus]|uniref:3,4-dihydroxy-2-butanone-4-phosphate synthase n=1 Tax=unclassified Chelatococcus TaxID=2638111 RepID=UPI001BCA68EC|nr:MULTISPECIES: 3,4-dihydroxy-2-butanone-4-phosphate synthase [unclassified Chelatococcus]CAH1659547.1 3,4-dihydroxy-2-butanone-4-phosphate synthase [Hyphomicrobiales bacterium]MBS7740959.1 3,4-dihydroxy-2-butanone-4-phosphate synthase [Chelatococcus sp. HY11]MBX3546750.1 3,4-dihydroxy-2-butanone-4-phosphate synthase [Chelatococcus sp.]MCO5077779.1 3,4-dihydroxy-2-butanone-4-phosphate synthase [Chelatococcus sp.]CAH1683776.1 3,4-dihydroxy-2-butanone-4-phosphate synthase [Hyphomicrobiales bact
MNILVPTPPVAGAEVAEASKLVSASLRVARAVADLRAGKGVIVTDSEDRENEGDFVFSAENLTIEQMALMIREGSGIVCLVISDARALQLELPPMVQDNQSKFGTGFTVSIEARHGVSSGVSAADRVRTIQAAVAIDAEANDLVRPGHVFPLKSHPEGLHGRQGHTEATLELMRLAGLRDAGVLCEITNPDGTMARGDDLDRSATRNGMVIVSISDILVVIGECGQF